MLNHATILESDCTKCKIFHSCGCVFALVPLWFFFLTSCL
uniref:Uncharacterized protein n=1 Tax=Rhizophora mucronata TaxID=61149 RepID=A0A2P2QFF3_RHIMU